MTDVEIRPITPDDDFDAQLDLGYRAFGVYPAQQRASWLRAARLRAGQGLFLGAFIGGAPVGAAMLHDMRQYWAGQRRRVRWRRRRQGRARVPGPRHRPAADDELLDLIAERGYPLSALYPATMPVYRSLGWELAGAKHRFTVPARSLLALREPDEDARGGGAGHRDVAIRRAGPADAATVVGSHRRKPPGRPRLRPGDLGRRTGRRVARPREPVHLPSWRHRRRRLRRLPLGRTTTCGSSACTPGRRRRCAHSGR